MMKTINVSLNLQGSIVRLAGTILLGACLLASLCSFLFSAPFFISLNVAMFLSVCFSGTYYAIRKYENADEMLIAVMGICIALFGVIAGFFWNGVNLIYMWSVIPICVAIGVFIAILAYMVNQMNN